MRIKNGAMFVFGTVRNTEVSPGAATDGFTAIRKTNALHAPQYLTPRLNPLRPKLLRQQPASVLQRTPWGFATLDQEQNDELYVV
jgi:hypothetical protein